MEAMYQDFYGLKEHPFALVPDSRFLYLGNHHDPAMTLLEYSVLHQAGFTLVTGEIGCGKTTLVRALLDRIESDVTVGLITNTHASFDALTKWVLNAFGLEYQGLDEVERYQRFVDFLIGEFAAGRRTVLILDEAQNMTPAMLEELRLLSNVNADGDQVLQLILLGQPQLRALVQHPDLVQFVQRVAVSYHLEPLDCDESRNYARHRLVLAGATIDPFRTTAHHVIHRHSGGIPRLINLLCDTALVYGYGMRRKRLDEKIVEELMEDRIERGLLPSMANRRTLTAAEHSVLRKVPEADQPERWTSTSPSGVALGHKATPD